MVTVIGFDYGQFNTNLTVTEAAKAINDGTPVRVWWFNALGERFEEDYLFFSDPQYIRTESDV